MLLPNSFVLTAFISYRMFSYSTDPAVVLDDFNFPLHTLNL